MSQGSASVDVPEQVGVMDVVTITTINLGDLFDEDGNPIASGAPGDPISLMGGGFDPDTSVDINIESEPIFITTTTADSNGDIDVTFAIPVVPAGDHSIVASGISPQAHPHQVQVPLTVLAPVSISFDASNPVSVPVSEPGGDSEPFSLTATISEVYPGQVEEGLGSSEAGMVLQPVGPGSPIHPWHCDTTLNGALNLTCTFDRVPVNTHVVTSTVGGLYSGSGEDVVVVYDESLGFATGGGWFYWPDTDDRTNFGFTMKYNKNGNKVQGSLLVIRHMSDGSVYRVRSNSLKGLSLGSDGFFDWASFAGKTTFQEPGWTDSVGNHGFIVYVEDHHAGADRFWIEVTDKDDLPTDLSFPAPAVDEAVPLGGGNVTVPQTSKRFKPV